MPRGIKGTGYKRKRGNSYQIQVYKKDGSRHYETVRGPEYKANKRISEILTDIDRGDYIEPSKLTFYKFLTDEFLPHILADKSQGAWEEYKGITENHIKNDPLGKKILTDITNRDATAYKMRKLTAKRVDGKPGTLAPKTINNHIVMIKAAFEYAVELDIFKVSPVKKLSFLDVPEHEMKVFDDEQAAKFIQAAYERTINAKSTEEYIRAFKMYLYFLLAIYTGMRQGELGGLRWEDINEKTLLISVVQQVRKNKIKKKLKTKASKSTVSFDSWFIPMFEQQRKLQIKDMEKCAARGIRYHNNHLVFASFNGNPLDRKVITRHIKYICKDADIPIINPHGFRHTCATLLIAEGVPIKVVQERLRQADFRTTANIYSHVLPKMQREANEKMNKVLKFKKPYIENEASQK